MLRSPIPARSCPIFPVLLVVLLGAIAAPRLDAEAASSNVLISQVYAAGGETGAPWQNDYIVLFNKSGATVSLAGWTLQMKPALAPAWQSIPLCGSIDSGHYYLVQLAAGGPVGAPLPPADCGGSVGMDKNNFTVVLLSDSAPLVGSCPAPPTLMDRVGWGPDLVCAEGTPATPPADPTFSMWRSSACIDTDANSADFTTSLADPLNSGATDPCVNQAPVIDPIPPLQVDENALLDQAASAMDPDGDIVTLSLLGEPSFVTLTQNPPPSSTATGTIRIQPGPNATEGLPSKDWCFQLVATDDKPVPASSQRTVCVTVNRTNTTPTFDSPPPGVIVVVEGETAQSTIAASDLDSEQTLSFSLVNPPSFATVTTDPTVPGGGATGTLTVTTGPNSVGKYCFNVRVQDSDVAAIDVPVCVTVFSTSANMPHAGIWPGGVNMASGELIRVEAPDLSLGGPMPVEFARHYGSFVTRMSGTTGALGPNWGNLWGDEFDVDAGVATITDAQQGRMLFDDVPGVGWVQRNHLEERCVLETTASTARLYRSRKRLVFEFDIPTGRLSRVLDEIGNYVRCVYGPDGLSQVTDDLGRTISFTYDPLGRMASASDGTRSVLYAYDASGRLATVTDPEGGVTTYSYAPGPYAGLLTGVTLPEGNTPVTYLYDSSGYVVDTELSGGGQGNHWDRSDGLGSTMTTPAGHLWRATHDARQRLVTLRDPHAGERTFAYDASDRLVSAELPGGETTTFAYHPGSGYVADVGRPNGTHKLYDYTTLSLLGFDVYRISSVSNPDATTESYGYDPAGNPVSHVDRAGKTWSGTFNGRGQVLTATNPTGGVTTFAYDALARLTSRTASGNTTAYQYDALNRLTLVTHPDLTTRALTYDGNNYLVAWEDEAGEVWNQPVDGNGRRASRTNPLGHTTTFEYDAMDRLTTVTNALGADHVCSYEEVVLRVSTTDPTGLTTTYDYDALDRLVSRTDPGGSVTTYGYDANGRLTSVTDPLSHTRSYGYDSMGRRTSTTDPTGNTTQYTYDAMGRRTTTVPPLGPITSYGYDPRGLLLSSDRATFGVDLPRTSLGRVGAIEDGNHNLWPYTYDPAGRMTSKIDPVGRSIAYTYDSRGRVTQAVAPDIDVDIVYHEIGHGLSWSFSDGLEITRTLDAARRVTAATGASFAYDNAGRMTSSNGVSVAYDPAGRITSETLAPGKTVTHTYNSRGLLATTEDWLGGVTTFTYDAAGRLTSLARPNGITTTYQYDAADRLTQKVESQPGPVQLYSVTLTRDALGRVVSRARDGQLHSTPPVGTESFAYDAASQVTGWTYDGLGRLRSDGTTTFEWDGASRLKHYAAGADSPRFTYDAFGRMLTRSIGGTLTDQFVWSYADARPTLAALLHAAHQHYFIHTPSGMLLHRIDTPSDQSYFYHSDEEDNVIFISTSSAEIATKYDYMPHGTGVQLGLTEGNPFTYRGAAGVMQVGDFYLAGTSLIEPRTGRCISCPAVPGASALASLDFHYVGIDIEARYVGPGFDASKSEIAIETLASSEPSTICWRAELFDPGCDDKHQSFTVAWPADYPDGSTTQWAYIGLEAADRSMGKPSINLGKKEVGGRHTPFFKGYRPQFYLRTTDVTGTVTLPEGREMVMPGDDVGIHVPSIQDQGIQAGWYDTYSHALDGQWLDITGLAGLGPIQVGKNPGPISGPQSGPAQVGKDPGPIGVNPGPIQAGWSDTYSGALDGQWIDIGPVRVRPGLVTGVKDPERPVRVKVKLGWQSDNSPYFDWARIASPSAGSSRGVWWLPEVNDEVLIMFEHGD